ncbi:MAG: hypothetical protein H6702_25230 [Myxococcales bacterium]|nr:hypothetical protein [Myxococcales bacterium]
MGGWFDFLRDKAARIAAAEARAAEVAAGDGWQDAVWAALDDVAFVPRVYAAVAARDPAVTFAFDRAQRALGNDAAAVRGLLEEGVGPAAAWLAHQLYTARASALGGLLLSGADLGRPVTALVPEAVWGPHALVLAGSPHATDRDAALAVPDRSPQWQAIQALRMADRDDARADPVLREVLIAVAEGQAEAWGLAGDRGAPGALLEAAAARKLTGVRAAAVALVSGPAVLEAGWALCHLPGDEGLETLRALRRQRLGDDRTDRVARLACALPIAVASPTPGAVADALVQARAVRADVGLQRYGWPKVEHLNALHRLVGEALLRFGHQGERAWVAGFAHRDDRRLRALADRALRGAPPRTFWDAARVDAADVAGVIAALESPDTVFVEAAFNRLRGEEGLDAPQRARVTAAAVAHIEARDEVGLQRIDQADPDARAALRWLAALPAGEQRPLAKAGEAHLWIRRLVLEEKPAGWPLPRPEGRWVATAFDRAPFLVGKQINGLAVSPDGALVLTVGDGLAALVDPATGALVRRLESPIGWAFAAAFDPTGERVVVTFHAGHVRVYEVATGAWLYALEGHGGVPHGVRCAAWLADGRTVITGGADGRLIGWDVATRAARWVLPGEGTWQAVAQGPDGTVRASLNKATGGQKNRLATVDPQTGAATWADREASVWALAWADGAWAEGGEASPVVCGARRWSVGRVTALAADAQGLWAASESGRLCRLAWDGEVTDVATGNPLWSLALAPDGAVYAGGKAGRVMVVRDGALVGEAKALHTTRVVAAVPLGDSADLVTVDWDGQVIRWTADGQGARVVDLGVTAESMAAWGADHVAVGTRKGLRLVRLSDGAVVAQTEARADEIALQNNRLAHSDGAGLQVLRLPDLAPEPPVALGRAKVNAVCALPDGGWLVGTEAGAVARVSAVGAVAWQRQAHGADKYEEGNPHANCCSVVAAPDGRWLASAATDHTARVFTPEGEPLWRISTGFGLFNRLAVSPDGRLLAVPADGLLALWEVATGRRVAALPRACFFGETLAGGCWLPDGALVMLTDAGRLFTVREEGAA